jgi:fatty acid desaturase
MNKEKSGYLAEQWEGNRWTLKLLWGYLFFLPPLPSFFPSFLFLFCKVYRFELKASIGGHSDHFYFLALVNSTAVDMRVQMSPTYCLHFLRIWTQ